ncbi:macrophage-expressed gene 1 protein-like [Sycon ciliatum]|uniref:macrophage-expressed gene 1 protein-like n=1 Tax=Sycon ciliatum TaxID=27933 RepID=UPI0020ABE6EA|eukprot:scpid41017/ scgid11125/ Macrophage-expressed gene 1 protein
MERWHSFAVTLLLVASPLSFVLTATVQRQPAGSLTIEVDSPDDSGARTQYESPVSLESYERKKDNPYEPAWYKCAKATGVNLRMEILPGWGWDALTSNTMGFMHDMTYDLCQTTPDGKYLIPDQIQAVKIKSSDVKQFSEVFESFKDYQDTTTASFNLNVNFPFVSGSLSGGFYDNKRNQVSYKSSTARTEIRHESYQLAVKPDAALSPQLKNRLLVIGDLIHSNESEAATHEVELLIRDFGTHRLRRVTAGGIFQQEDQVTNSYRNDSATTSANVRAAASSTFLVKIGFKFSYSISVQQLSEFSRNVTQSLTRTFGGNAYLPGMTVAEWDADLDRSLVAVDRGGDPIEYVITPESVPELPAPTVMQISEELARASKEYFEANTHRGCTDVNSANFNFKANSGDRSLCNPVPHNYTFGGIYQTCTVQNGEDKEDFCKPLTQKNPSTGDFQCPPMYEPVLLHTGVHTTYWQQPGCRPVKYTYYTVFGPITRELKVCSKYVYSADAVYQTYWCVRLDKVAARSGYLFGGIYSDKYPNPVTELWTCPQYFYALTMGNGMKVCISNDYKNGYDHARPFAGFYSCTTGNPLSLANAKPTTAPMRLSETGFDALTGESSWPKECPSGYSMKLAGIDDGCQINYCSKSIAYPDAVRPQLYRPPYSRTYPPPGNHTIYVTEITGPGGEMWRKNLTTEVWSKVILGAQPLGYGDQAEGSVLDSTSSHGRTLVYTLVPAAVVVLALALGLAAQHKQIKHLEVQKTPESRRPQVSLSVGPSPRANISLNNDLLPLAEQF